MIINVENSKDSAEPGPIGSLRNAIYEANKNLTNIPTIIEISPCVRDIKLQSELVINSNIEIIAKNNLNIELTNLDRHFHVVTNSINPSSNNILTIKTPNKKYKIVLSAGKSLIGGSIFIEQTNHNLILENVIITNNSALNGGGIYTKGNLYLVNSHLDKNTAIKQGGGAWVTQNITMTNSTINDNIVSEMSNDNFGGGLAVDDGDLIMNNSQINNNIVNSSETLNIGGSAGGINVMSGSIYATNSSISNNKAYSSGGIQLGVGDINLNKSSVSNNESYISGDDCGGGGIVITLGNVILQESKLSNNNTKGMYSGSLVSFIGNVTVLDSIISGNVNRGPGGGIACNFNSTVTISNSKIVKNSGSSLGGAIVNFSNTVGQIAINNSELSNNNITNYQTVGQTIKAFLTVIKNLITSTQANATATGNSQGSTKLLAILPKLQSLADETDIELQKLLLLEEIMILTGGGAIATLLKCPITIDKSCLVNNFATKIVTDVNPEIKAFGGAVFGPNSPIFIQDSNLSNNTSITDAGAIYTDKKLVTNNVVIKGNNTYKNGTLSNSLKGNMILINTKLYDNVVDNNGGGIFNTGNVILIDSLITKNTATNGTGGGIFTLDKEKNDNIINIDSVIKCNKPNDFNF